MNVLMKDMEETKKKEVIKLKYFSLIYLGSVYIDHFNNDVIISRGFLCRQKE